jgi:hypothetical protein
VDSVSALHARPAHAIAEEDARQRRPPARVSCARASPRSLPCPTASSHAAKANAPPPTPPSPRCAPPAAAAVAYAALTERLGPSWRGAYDTAAAADARLDAARASLDTADDTFDDTFDAAARRWALTVVHPTQGRVVTTKCILQHGLE